MATGLIALVDDCIKERWQRPAAKKAVPLLAPLALSSKAVHLDAIMNPRAIMQHVFGRRYSDGAGQRPATPPSPGSPLRFARAVAAH